MGTNPHSAETEPERQALIVMAHCACPGEEWSCNVEFLEGRRMGYHYVCPVCHEDIEPEVDDE